MSKKLKTKINDQESERFMRKAAKNTFVAAGLAVLAGVAEPGCHYISVVRGISIREIQPPADYGFALDVAYHRDKDKAVEMGLIDEKGNVNYDALDKKTKEIAQVRKTDFYDKDFTGKIGRFEKGKWNVGEWEVAYRVAVKAQKDLSKKDMKRSFEYGMNQKDILERLMWAYTQRALMKGTSSRQSYRDLNTAKVIGMSLGERCHSDFGKIHGLIRPYRTPANVAKGNINWTADLFPGRYKIARERCDSNLSRTGWGTLGATGAGGGAKIYAHGKGHRGSGNPYNGEGPAGPGGN